MLHHSHRLAMRRALILVAVMTVGLVLIWAVPFWAGFQKIEDYVPIHTMLEMASVVIAVLVFASGWNAYSRNLPRHALILACAFLGVAMLDFAHALSYVGMPHFVTASSPQKAINFWLVARLLAASALLTVAVLPPENAASRGSRYGWLAGVMVLVGVTYWACLFHADQLPQTYKPGSGLTAFKIGAEFLVIAMNLAAACSFWLQMRRPLRFNAAALFGAVCVMALSECFFTLYATTSDFYNVAGHVYKLVSYLFLYRAVFIEVIEEPYREMARMGDQLRATLDAVPDVMLELDLHGRYHAVHSSRLETLVRPADDLMGRTVQEVLPAAEASVVMSALEEALSKGTSSGAQLQLSLPHGVRWFELSVSRKGGVHGLDTRFIMLSRDITERKMAEAALLEQQAILHANQVKSQFLSRVSHELRTPLNAVIGFAQLLLHDANARMAAGQRLHVEYILRAGQHLLEMINDILDLTRIESGDAGLKIEPVRIGELIAQSLPMVMPQAEAMGVTVSVDTLKVDRRQVLGDERRIRQVLINVLSNAVKYNRVGGQVMVHASLSDARPGHLVVRVADTGRGVRADLMKDLFEPFNRLGADRDGIEGTGLGLVISRRLMEAMGGEISLDSTEGVGTTVTMSLPLMGQAASTTSVPAPAVDMPPVRPSMDRNQTTVLCVEDNPLNAALLRAIFDLRPTVKLLIAEDGESALARMQHVWPDLVLVDINLPDMSGVEVLHHLRAMPHGQDLMCIAMSADVSGEPHARALAQGFADFWPKPLNVDGVLLRLDAALSRVNAERRETVRQGALA
ncbi:MAG TPA: MASE3 domain-containing protein [Aquabacterium sp.]|uniref:MASE3 domain-containing protein n=1 Tax=Aquabacterium sp. TaxID=1872578 RepID=UPI002E34A568|nr:MASE3 domain-containing protein [Aquabacterium sp.]HEX5356637.1 MASE3 domain-containing protein [Aquabacterium sp.]